MLISYVEVLQLRLANSKVLSLFLWPLVRPSVYLSKMFERKHITMELGIPQCVIYIVTYGSLIGRMVELTIQSDSMYLY